MTQTCSLTDIRTFVERMFASEFAFMREGGSNLQLLMDAFHPQVVIHEPLSLPYAGDWEGLNGVAALLTKMNAAWSDMTVSELEIHGDGERVLLACQLRMVVRRSGQIVEQPFAERLHYADGILMEGTPFYFDTVEIAAALNSDVREAD
jgi:ketosteroid isomerase-like protein